MSDRNVTFASSNSFPRDTRFTFNLHCDDDVDMVTVHYSVVERGDDNVEVCVVWWSTMLV